MTGNRFAFYADGVQDVSLGLPPLRLPQVNPSQEDLNREAVQEKGRNRPVPSNPSRSGTT